MLKIVTVPNKILREKSTPVKMVDKKIAQFIESMAETLVKKTNPAGVGLSAIQVGKPWRVFITYLPDNDQLDRYPTDTDRLVTKVFINPEIVELAGAKTLGPNPDKPWFEGCLSIPGIYGPVWRKEKITLKYQTFNISELSTNNYQLTTKKTELRIMNYELRTITSGFSHFPARVIQHEIDHLNGILFTDHSVRDKLPIYEEKKGKLLEVAF